ncbi:MAG: hypothetical protein GYA55_05985 [SAR324 cluster bacterium]|uniref:Uncharacterized protein n=1 Tax=SAR324 cluster bacterium TaxID=2024889 RepID=A0A7X9FR25_9DELT|nr:hypothetical protein [SAR324 cluster bacterium]
MTDPDIKETSSKQSLETEKEAPFSKNRGPASNRGELLDDLKEQLEKTKVDKIEDQEKFKDTTKSLQAQIVSTEQMKEVLSQELEAAKETKELQDPSKNSSQQNLEEIVDELLHIIKDDNIGRLAQFMKDHDVPKLASAYESVRGQSLESKIKEVDPEFDDGCIRSFLKEELLETCSQLLARAIRKGHLTSLMLSELSQGLSDPELRELIETYGVMFVSNLSTDILHSLPEIDRFEAAPIVSTLFGTEKEVLHFLKEEAERYHDLDPTNSIIDAVSITLQEAAKSLEKTLQETLRTGDAVGVGLRGAVNSRIKEASRKLQENARAKRERAKMQRLFRVAAAATLGLLFSVLGNANTTFKCVLPVICGYGAWLTTPVPLLRNPRRR